MFYSRVGERIYYHGPHDFCIIACERQNQLILKSDFSWLTRHLLIMELHFDAKLYSNLPDENSDAGHIKCSHGPHLVRGLQIHRPCPIANPPIESCQCAVVVFTNKPRSVACKHVLYISQAASLYSVKLQDIKGARSFVRLFKDEIIKLLQMQNNSFLSIRDSLLQKRGGLFVPLCLYPQPTSLPIAIFPMKQNSN